MTLGTKATEEFGPVHSAEGFFADGVQTWQVEHIGHLVTAFGEAQNLKPEKLAALVECYIGIGFNKDTLRRFLDRLGGSQPSFAQKTTSAETLEKLASFLAHPDIGLVSLEHLRFRSFPTTAPIGFISSLLFDLDEALPRLHSSYGGTYKVAASGAPSATSTELSVSIESDKDWFVVRMKSQEQDAKVDEQTVRVRDGWGIMLPDNGLFIHLKNARSGRNTLFSTPMSPLDFASDRSDSVALVLHDNADPMEIADWTTMSGQVGDQWSSGKIYKFQWYSRKFLGGFTESGTIDETGGEAAETKQKWDGSLKDNPFLKNSRFFDQQKASERAKDKFDAENMEKNERYLGQRFIEAVQELSNDQDTLKEILGDGQALNAQDPFNGFTALHYAVGDQNRRRSLWLTEQPGIDLTIQDKRGRTPAMLAAIIVAEEGSSSLLDVEFVETLRGKEVEQIRQKIETGDPDLPPGYQTRDLDDI